MTMQDSSQAKSISTTAHSLREANGNTYAGISHFAFDDALAYERKLLSQIAEAGQGWVSSIWTTDQALIVPFSTTHEAGFKNAQQQMGEQGWPVLVRHTGGDVTPQSPGVINVSFVFCVPRQDDFTIRKAYETFCQPILDYLSQELRISGYLSSIEGAFCDGAYNVVVAGQKLAGTAQRWRLTQTPDGRPAVAVLGHAAMLWDADIKTSISATNAFYESCAVDRTVIVEKHVSLKQLMAEQGVRNSPDVKAFDEFLKNYAERWLAKQERETR